MIELLYKDLDIIVCVKPEGLLSTKDSSNKANMEDVLKEENNLSEIYPIHRLDREVEGVMVYALNKSAAANLSKDVANHLRFAKKYLAVVNGCPENDSGILEDLLFKDSSKNKSYVVKRERKGVKKAKLEYELLATDNSKSLLRIKLFTGRTHQIRVQLSSRNMSIFGDKKYGGKPYQKLALFCESLSFIHPKTGEELTFTKKPENSIFIF